ncbi:MAG: hypothetical protein CSA68_04750 [Rhodobacterales bacterium]|nr:MAG: hypothetical protein CSA68_04750 [Rhodobacterales bacterium]
MTDVRKTFADAVIARLDELGQNAFAIEKAGGLPVDAIRSVIRDDDKRAVPRISRAKEICDLLDLEFYIGPPRSDPAPVAMVKNEPFDTVPRYDAASAAGDGVVNFDGPPIDHLAFSKTWLAQNGINAGACVLINVKGDSMEPSIYDGDLVMIDRRRKAIRTGHLYVFRDGEEGLRLKRLDVIPDTAITLRSDNPKYPPEPRTGEAMNAISQGIVGEVVWSGHKWV